MKESLETKYISWRFDAKSRFYFSSRSFIRCLRVFVVFVLERDFTTMTEFQAIAHCLNAPALTTDVQADKNKYKAWIIDAYGPILMRDITDSTRNLRLCAAMHIRILSKMRNQSPYRTMSTITREITKKYGQPRQ